MRITSLAQLILISAACAAPSAAPPPSTAPAPAPPPETGTYTLRVGENTVATESFVRSFDELRAELTTPRGERINITARIRSDASVAHIEVREFARGAEAGAAPVRVSTGTFVGDSVRLTAVSNNEPAQTRTSATVRGAVVYVNPSPSLLEQILRRARVIGSDPVEVPLWIPASGGQNTSATVKFAPNSAELSIGSVEVQAQTDALGRLLSGSIPSQGLTIERSPLEGW